jgi:hypothetical protein
MDIPSPRPRIESLTFEVSASSKQTEEVLSGAGDIIGVLIGGQ